MDRVGILLAGCGVYDGSEARETVLLTLALARRGFRIVFLAPDVDQADVVDHTTSESGNDTPSRRVLVEAARLTRGAIEPLGEPSLAGRIDALVIPGGLGVVKNLCGPGSGPLGGGPPRREVASLLDELSARRAPVAVVGLGEVVLARHQNRPLSRDPLAVRVSEVVVDEDRRTLFTPGFMGSDSIVEVARGLDALVDALAERLPARGPGRARGMP